MLGTPYGLIVSGDVAAIGAAYEKMAGIPVDQELLSASPADEFFQEQTTIGGPVEFSGPGTFLRKAHHTVTFRPCHEPGWWFSRRDLPSSLPIYVSVKNVWTTARNIVLCSGSPHNYMRMVEHIVALKAGMGVDNLIIDVQSGDPPLFDRSSMDLVEAVESARLVKTGREAVYVTVKEPVTMAAPNGGFLTFVPAENKRRHLEVDCAVDFNNAMGRQRIRFLVNRATFRHGAFARTNTNLWMMLYCKTVGKIFADVRNLGYTMRNILVAGPHYYFNQPRLVYNGKALEAVWHRATLDLLAVVALIDEGRFAGKIISYKAGHAVDVQMIKELYQRGLLERV